MDFSAPRRETRAPAGSSARARAAALAAALAFAGALGLAAGEAAAQTKPPKPKPRPERVVTPPAPVSFKSACVDPARTVTVAAVGDVLLHDMFQKWASEQKDGFYGAFQPVADLIGAADVAFANLEGPAAEGVASNGKPVRPPDKRYDKAVYRGYPMFNYHPSVITDLKRAGFDVLTVANNHSLDRHQLGVDRTIEALRKAAMPYTGTRHREAMSAPWHAIVPVRSAAGAFNIAFLGCTYGTNGLPDRANQVLHCYEQRDEVAKTVRDLAARADVHAVMVAPHWGNEYQHRPDAKQIEWAREMLEAGATAILGAHPHVMQPIEKYTTKDGRETLIAYSLGNFVSNQIGMPRKSAAIVLLGLTPAESGKLAPNAVGWIPLHMHTSGRFYVEAIDRAKGGAGKVNRDHLVQHLPPANIHPPTPKLWSHVTCRS